MTAEHPQPEVLYERAAAAARFIRSRAGREVRTALVLGSG